MTVFTARNASTATLDAPVAQVWAALVDPDLIARLTPYLDRIEVDGDRWRWHMVGLPIPTGTFSPAFTELMTFEPMRRITYRHDPSRPDERAAAEGTYDLVPLDADRTQVSIDITISVDLPIPRLARPVVEKTMDVVVANMGNAFGDGLIRHLQR